MRRGYTALVIAMTGALLLTAAWGYGQYKARTALAIDTENNYQRSFYEMANHTENLEVALAKSLASRSPKDHAWTGTDIWQQAYAAEEDLGQLPVNEVPLMRTAKFFNQMGDYAYVLTTQSEGEGLTEEQRNTLEKMHSEVVFLNAELKKMSAEFSRGQLRWIDGGRAEQRFRQTAMKLAVSGFGRMEDRLVKYPTLTYDGAFSEHMLSAQHIQGKSISQSEAMAAARSFLGMDGVTDAQLLVLGKRLGTDPAYQIQATGNTGVAPVTYVEVSQAGGHVTWMLKNPPAGTSQIPIQEAQQRAITFLEQRGFRNMKFTGYQKLGNELVVSLAQERDNVLYYPGTVKVKVGLNSGAITGYDARSWLVGNVPEQIPKPKLTVAEARRKVSPVLQVSNERLAIIPTEAGKEILAYEFKGAYKGLVFLVYINALTGEEENILQVVERPGEVLTM
ncbi:MAG: germination protein YpeB [Bacillota bacterium]